MSLPARSSYAPDLSLILTLMASDDIMKPGPLVAQS